VLIGKYFKLYKPEVIEGNVAIIYRENYMQDGITEVREYEHCYQFH
jgi:hypothetical protein